MISNYIDCIVLALTNGVLTNAASTMVFWSVAVLGMIKARFIGVLSVPMQHTRTKSRRFRKPHTAH